MSAVNVLLAEILIKLTLEKEASKSKLTRVISTATLFL